MNMLRRPSMPEGRRPGLAKDIVHAKNRAKDQRIEELTELAHVDRLTKAASRVAFSIDVDRINKILLRSSFPESRDKRPTYSVLYIDIDYFKKINDTCGHRFADKVLANLVAIIKPLLRPYDEIYRVGGEEFVILLPNCALNDAIVKAEALRAEVEKNLKQMSETEIDRIEDREAVTISVGVWELPEGDLTIEDTIGTADDCLYNAKQSGRNRVSSTPRVKNDAK